MKARDLLGAVFGRSATRSNDAATVATSASSRRVEGTGAPRARLALGAFAILAATLVLGVAFAGAAAPLLTIENATNVEYTTAHVKGEVDPEDHETSYHFEWVTEEQFTTEGEFAAAEPNGQVAGFGSTPEGVPAAPEETLSGLHPATTYHLRLVAENTEGEHAEAVAASTFTTKAVAKPLVSGLAVSETHFSGMVNPNAPEAAPASDAVKAGFNTHWSFTCEPGCGFSGASEGDLEADNAATEVSADPTGLTPNQTFDITLHATNAGGETTETKVAAFTTSAVKPTVIPATLFNLTRTSIRFNASVNPHNATLTDCHFAYGTAGSLDHTAPCETLPGGEGATGVSAQVSDLTPDTLYEYRLLATNSAGTTEGDVRTFTTPAEPVEESCPNQSIRDAQHATQLAECRAWEKTTPADKGHGDIVGDGATNFASADGDAIVFSTRTPFGDTVGSGVSGQTQYITRRSTSGWAAHAITPQPRSDAYQTYQGATLFLSYSDDLRDALVWGYDFPSAIGDLPLRNNIYTEDLGTRALTPVTALQQGGLPNPLPDPFAELSEPTNWGVSADAQHVTFVSKAPYLPAIKQVKEEGEQEATTPNAYQFDEGVLSLIGVLPDGTIPSAGSDVIGGIKTPTIFPDAMSTDGSRQLFVSPPSGSERQLYQRIEGDRTVWVSEPEGTFATPEQVRLLAATPDGRTVLFTTESGLVPEDENGGIDLYRWSDGPDPAHDLTMITRNGGFESGQVAGVSDNGARVYYHTAGNDLAVWDQGATHLISSGLIGIAPTRESLAVDAFWPGYGRVSPDGNYFAFATDATSDGSSGPTGEATNGHREMYLYDLAAETLGCISCPSGPATSDVTVMPEVTTGVPSVLMQGLRPRFLSNDGRVFFSTGEALVPQDTNGVLDAYQYNPATASISLLSSGRGADPATFVDSSPSADDAFFLTRQRLVPSDTDDLVDLFDARAGGGFSESPPLTQTQCGGEGCQPAAALAPPTAPPVSRAQGRGNVRSHRPHCDRRRAKKGAHAKNRRCTRKKGGTNKRHANGNRRASK